jgi:hypothetical protein
VQLGVWASAAAFLLSQLTSCGSGGSNLADGGIGGTGVIAAGAVTAKGSIFVNGIEYSVEGAAFERDGVSQTLAEDEQSTRIGMVLEVEGTLAADGQTGRATNLRFKDLVEGTIDSSLSNSTGIKLLTILAQPVVVADGLTSFAGDLNFDTIEDEPGFLEVSGFRRADGRIQASYIERKAAGRFEVTGAVTAIAADGLTFRIGELTVTDSGLPPLPDDLDGALVRAEGAFYDPVSRTLDATSISLQDPGLSRADADRAEVEGFVANDFFSDGGGIPAETIFRVDGQDVVYTTATEFVRGSAEDLINNTKVEVEGPLLGGVLSAEKIEFKENLKFQGPVSDVSANSLALAYPDASGGTSAVVVSVDPAVTEEDTRFADVSVNDSVKLEGQLLGDGTALATRLRELEPANGRIILQAPVESFDPATGLLSLLGVTIDASGLSFSDDDLEMTRAEFFAALQIGSLVKAQGDQPERWDSLELER